MARFIPFGAIALVGGALLAVTGCTQSVTPPTASPSPSVSVAASVTASPSPTSLSDEELLALIPARANQENFYGASQFAAFFLELYPRLFERAADVSLFQRLSDEECVFCNAALRDAGDTADANAYSEGGIFTFEAGSEHGGQSDSGTWLVGQRFLVTDTLTYLDDGTLTRTSRGGTGVVALELEFVAGHWSVLEVEFTFDDEG